ncbi:MAG: aldo/keto reductase [Pseudomonadota bacterium]|nr:aldo/keto reductase [Pseudomonadota bacterium]
MKKRKLGANGPEVSAIGLGCMGMTIKYGQLDDEHSIETIQHALDNELNLLNSSDAYGNGKNEELIALAIKNRRSDVVLNTKFGQIRNPDGTMNINGRPEYVKEACEKSLKRLETDYIDIYSQHRVDTTVPIEETVGAMSRLVEQGKILHVGLSEAAAETVIRANKTYPIVCLETEYSLWSREVEEEILPTCQELGISLMPYAPIGRGFLSGSIRSSSDLDEDDQRVMQPRFAQENINKNIKKLEVLEDIASRKGFKPAQVAIAWVLQQDDNLVPIPGTKRTKYLNENMRAIDLFLDDDDLKSLSSVFAVGETAGTRYPAGHMKLLGV